LNSKFKIQPYLPMPKELLQQVRVLDPVSEMDRVCDLLIQDGVIQAIAPSITNHSADTVIRDCRGLVLGPGLVDLYSHSGEPGFEQRETLNSLRQAAIAGGFTRLTILPNTQPALDNPATIAWLHTPSAHPPIPPSPYLLPWAALTQAVEGQQMTELGELKAARIAGFADGKPLNNLLLVRRVLEYLLPLNLPIALWACDPTLAGNGVMREGFESIRFGLPGVPEIAETSALAALLECVAATGTPVHLMRISTARSVELIRAAKDRGLPITASTTWMHLLLNSHDIASYHPALRLDPPLGNPKDQAALLDGLQHGVLDAIAIDHSPYTYEEKTVAFAEAPPGAIGLEIALPLLWRSLVETGQCSALHLWRYLSTNPAHCLHQELTTISPNQPANLTLFDPNQAWIVNPESLKSLSSNTPWLGQEIVGRVVKVWCGS
jgi:dihydroorotase